MNYTKVESNFPYIQFSGISSVTDYHKKYVNTLLLLLDTYMKKKKK